jgi:hypothetical protein
MLVANFAAGVLVGVLLGLALAPVLRAWVLWKSVEETRRSAGAEQGLDSTRIDT